MGNNQNWFDGLRPEDLPGDLSLVAQECGIEIALLLAEKMGGITLHVWQADNLIASRKRAFIRARRNTLSPKQLALATGYSERQVYRILAGEDNGQEALPL